MRGLSIPQGQRRCQDLRPDDGFPEILNSCRELPGQALFSGSKRFQAPRFKLHRGRIDAVGLCALPGRFDTFGPDPGRIGFYRTRIRRGQG